MKKTNWKVFRKVSKRFIAVLGVLVAGIMSMTPMTVFAQVPEAEEQKCICETKCDENHINKECPVCSSDYTFCEGGEVVEEETEEPMGPLTPDGNLELVDDYGSIVAGGKQFITVATKSGNYFYIIIDRDDNGTEKVHFLNMVDESDLLALMDEEAVKEYMSKTRAGEIEEPVVEEITEVTEPEEPEEEPEKSEKPKKNNVGMLVLILVVIGGGAGAYFYFTKVKNKKPAKSGVDPDADYYEGEEDYLENLSEEEFEDVEVDADYDSEDDYEDEE